VDRGRWRADVSYALWSILESKGASQTESVPGIRRGQLFHIEL
jgi:hypothetical protein